MVSIGIPLTSGRRADMARTSASATFEEVALKVHTARKESPRDPLVDILLFRVAVADRPQDLIDFVAKASGVTPGQVRESPYLQVGSLSQVVAGFDRLVATGIDSIVVRVADMEAAALVRRALG